MRLFVRLNTDFFTHRKTINLVLKIGSEGYWIPPKLWCYAAESQPDGNFSQFSADALAMLLGCSSNAQAMLQALIDCGFMDTEPLRIHDWEKYNPYHADFSGRKKRATDAAIARWSKKKEPKKRRLEKENEKEQCLSNASASKAHDIYEAYPRKCARQKALEAIEKKLESFTFEHLLERTKAYSAAITGSDTIPPHASTWFNQDRFEDPESGWLNKPVNGQMFPKTTPGNGSI